jgi:hypothetical protein
VTPNPCNSCWSPVETNRMSDYKGYSCPNNGCFRSKVYKLDEWQRLNPLPAPPKGETMPSEESCKLKFTAEYNTVEPLTGPQHLMLQTIDNAITFHGDQGWMVFVKSELTRLWAMEAGR